jgi:hypothetical protein
LRFGYGHGVRWVKVLAVGALVASVLTLATTAGAGGGSARSERERIRREQAQAASEVVFTDVQKLYYGLRDGGRKSAVKAARAARRKAADAAEAAGRRPIAG